MGVKYEDLEEICETLGYKLKEANDRIRKSGGDVTDSDIALLDKLTHAIKSVKTTMAMMDPEGYSFEGGGMGGNNGGNAMGGRSGGRYDERYDNRYPGRSYARGRGQNARRDSMGRYSRSGGNEEIIEQLREIMQDAPDDKTRSEFERMISKLESM